MVTANYPNHVWHIDLTLVPTTAGLWCAWSPLALPQKWPFAWWVAVIVDHFSRSAMGIGISSGRPNCRVVCAFVGRSIRSAGTTPRYLVCDKHSIFDCHAFRRWIKRQAIQPPRYGAIGKHGSIAVVERFILTMKAEFSRKITVPLRRDAMRRELLYFVEWYNDARPSSALAGKTPNEVYHGLRPANRRPRIEPRPRWPRGSPCARPWALVAGKPGTRFTLKVAGHVGTQHLPIVSLQRAA